MAEKPYLQHLKEMRKETVQSGLSMNLGLVGRARSPGDESGEDRSKGCIIHLVDYRNGNLVGDVFHFFDFAVGVAVFIPTRELDAAKIKSLYEQIGEGLGLSTYRRLCQTSNQRLEEA